jgi:D-xylose transport system substrate-binding protein
VQTFLNSQKIVPDVILASNDDLAGEAIMALEMNSTNRNIIFTGQDASIEACRNIMAGKQLMTVYKPLKNLAKKAATSAVKLSKGEKITYITSTVNNGMKDVPSILLKPLSVDKNNMEETIVANGFINKEKL